jgi:hypothetical protein
MRYLGIGMAGVIGVEMACRAAEQSKVSPDDRTNCLTPLALSRLLNVNRKQNVRSSFV